MTTKEMPDLYRIKYWATDNPMKVMFGIVDKYDSKQQKLWKTRKQLIVKDAVTDREMICPIDDMGWEEQGFEDGNEFDMHIDKAHEQAIKEDRKAGKGVKVGKMFSMPVGDGQAVYVITYVGLNSVNVEWRAFGGGDRYVDLMFGYGGDFRKRDVEHIVKGQEIMADIYGGK